MACPICKSIGAGTPDDPLWTNDPVLTPLGLAGIGYKGITFICDNHITELQTYYNYLETTMGVTPTVFSTISPILGVTKTHILEIRKSVEGLLTASGKTIEDYFDSDKYGNSYTSVQTDWTDVDRSGDGFPKVPNITFIRAIHIEELRIGLVTSILWSEDWTDALNQTYYVYGMPQNGTIQGTFGKSWVYFGQQSIEVSKNVFSGVHKLTLNTIPIENHLQGLATVRYTPSTPNYTITSLTKFLFNSYVNVSWNSSGYVGEDYYEGYCTGGFIISLYTDKGYINLGCQNLPNSPVYDYPYIHGGTFLTPNNVTKLINVYHTLNTHWEGSINFDESVLDLLKLLNSSTESALVLAFQIYSWVGEFGLSSFYTHGQVTNLSLYES